MSDASNEERGEHVAFQVAPRFIGFNGTSWPFPNTPSRFDCDVLLRIRDNDGNIMVDVLPNGRVVLTEHYDADETARRFWGSLMWLAQELLKNPGAAGESV